MFSLNDKTALVTGAGRGLGFAIAEALARQGADVILCDYREDIAQAARDRLLKLCPERRLYALGFDIGSKDAVLQAADHVTRLTGSLDILVNNAGINIRGEVASYADKDWDRVLDINLNGVFQLCRALFPLLSRRGGKVLNMCSFMAEFARPGVAAYAASKGALRQLTRVLAVEWAPYNIQVNAMAPGYADTEINAVNKADRAFYDYTISRTPARRWAQPSEIGAAAAFLVSPAASFITGQTLCVDGGLSIAL